jgi:hypothetical protein
VEPNKARVKFFALQSRSGSGSGGHRKHFSHGAGLRTTSIRSPSLKFFNSASGSTIENENFSWSSFVAENRDSYLREPPSGTVQRGGNVKKQDEVSGPCATAALADDRGDAKKRPFHEIVPDGFSTSSLDVFERNECYRY